VLQVKGKLLDTLQMPSIDKFIALHSGWRYDDASRTLRRNFEFEDFKEAFAFMTQIALHAEQSDHHPEWTNVYNRVEMVLRTHDAGGVTQLDINLGTYAERAFVRFLQSGGTTE